MRTCLHVFMCDKCKDVPAVSERARVPLGAHEFSFAPLDVAMELNSDVADFFLARARHTNTKHSLYELQVASRWHNFWRSKRLNADGSYRPFLKRTGGSGRGGRGGGGRRGGVAGGGGGGGGDDDDDEDDDDADGDSDSVDGEKEPKPRE